MQKITKSISVYPFMLVYALFFLWGFSWNLFNILAAFFKETFHLSNTQTSLGTSLSFLSFFLMAYPSKVIIKRVGTQNAISLGSLIVSLGLLVFIPASFLKNYVVFLSGLFVLFSGITILQTVCNPYIGDLGQTKNRAARINFAQGIGAIGAALTAPLAGWFILERFENNVFDGIKWFFLILGIVFLILSLMVRRAKMPINQIEKQSKNEQFEDKNGAFRYVHFVIGFIIMFVYMGAEAILYQMMTPYFKEIGDITTAEAVKFSAIIFYGLMTGRLFGAWAMTRIKPDIILGIFAFVAALLVIASMVFGGQTGIYAITATGFFISIMFASIFSLATTGLGKYTNQASSLLIMGISGGFFIPLLYGIVADSSNLRTSLLVVAIPLLLTSLYGFGFNRLFDIKKLNNTKN
jgi:FHS family L-fucose permease-like MFS transporter